jgi:hypothetical protein
VNNPVVVMVFPAAHAILGSPRFADLFALSGLAEVSAAGLRVGSAIR